MSKHPEPRFPLIPLFLWVLLFGLAVFLLDSNPDLSQQVALRWVFGLGVSFTVVLTWWVNTRRKASSTTIDLFARAPEFTVPTATPALQDPNWIAALEREAWFELLQTMGEEAKVDRFVRIIPPQIQQLFPGTSIGFYVRDSKEMLNLYLRSGESFMGPVSMHMSECEAISRGQIVEESVGVDTERCTCSHHGHPGAMFVACVPILTEEHYFGLLSFYHPLSSLDQNGVSRASILQKGQTFASALAIYLQNISLKETIGQHLIRDAWTGLFNRRYMEETLFREFAEATRRRLTIGVVMVYPDQIAAIRATHGPKAAELISWEIGQRIPRYIRTEDIPCRYDEDLFCIILPGAALDITMQRGEKMRRELGGLNVVFQNQPLSTTFSVGVSVYPQHSTTVHGLITMTEMAVRNAQRQGGNRLALPPTTTSVNWDLS